MALAPWQNLGFGGIARLGGIKQYWEIQMLPGSEALAPIFIRRRITLLTLQMEIEYLEGVPEGTGPSEKADLWLKWLDDNTHKDWLYEITWYEPGDPVNLHTVIPYDDDGKGLPTSGKWLVDGKDLQPTNDGGMTVVCTWKNEGAYIPDAAR